MLKNQKGLSLVTMVITVLVLIIILSTLVYSGYTSVQARAINKLYNDIRTLNDAVSVYYLQNNALPLGDEYSSIDITDTDLDETATNLLSIITNEGTFSDQDDLVNPNDYYNGAVTYYYLNLDLLDNISLENTGNYIINAQSQMIFYVDGVTVGDETYYCLPLEYRDTEYNATHDVYSITTSISQIYLAVGNSLSLSDYLVFSTDEGLTAMPKSVTYSLTSYPTGVTMDDDGVITVADGTNATTVNVYVVATSYGTTDPVTATITIKLTDLTVYSDSETTTEIDTVSLLVGNSATVYASKTAYSGTIKFTNIGSNISVSTTDTSAGKSTAPVTIKGDAVGKSSLTILESYGKANQGLTVNVYNPSISATSLSFTSLSSTQNLTLTLDSLYTKLSISWSSDDEKVVTVEEDADNELKAVVTPVGFGSATISCEITVDGKFLTTLSSAVTVTGVSISDVSLTASNTDTLTFSISDDLEVTSVTWTSSDTAVATIVSNEDNSSATLTGVASGTTTITVIVTASDGVTYKDTCTVTVN